MTGRKQQIEPLTSGHLVAVVIKLALHSSTGFSHGRVELVEVVNAKLPASGWGCGQGEGTYKNG